MTSDHFEKQPLVLSGSASLKEIAAYYNVSTRTMSRKLIPYRHFFNFNKQKHVYFENELQFIKKIFGERNQDNAGQTLPIPENGNNLPGTNTTVDNVQ